MSNFVPFELTALIAFIGLIIVPLIILFSIYYILLIIADWRIFKKAGEAGWKSLIPIYNTYIMFKIVKMKNWFWWIIALGICTCVMFAIDGVNPFIMTEAEIEAFDFSIHPTTVVATLGMTIALIWTGITHTYRMAKVFGHGIPFTLGLIFLPNIFQLILGFGGSKYDKKRLKRQKK